MIFRQRFSNPRIPSNFYLNPSCKGGLLPKPYANPWTGQRPIFSCSLQLAFNFLSYKVCDAEDQSERIALTDIAIDFLLDDLFCYFTGRSCYSSGMLIVQLELGDSPLKLTDRQLSLEFWRRRCSFFSSIALLF